VAAITDSKDAPGFAAPALTGPHPRKLLNDAPFNESPGPVQPGYQGFLVREYRLRLQQSNQ